MCRSVTYGTLIYSAVKKKLNLYSLRFFLVNKDMLLIPKIHGKLLLQLVPISSCFAAKGPGLNTNTFIIILYTIMNLAGDWNVQESM